MEIVMTSAHKISESTPIAVSGGKPSADGLDDRLQGIQRARPEVAIDNASDRPSGASPRIFSAAACYEFWRVDSVPASLGQRANGRGLPDSISLRRDDRHSAAWDHIGDHR
jgi:hypothetical protein